MGKVIAMATSLGWIDKIKASTLTDAVVEAKMIEFLKLHVPASTSPVATYTVTFVPPLTGGTIRSDVRTPDSEVTLTNNPAVAVVRVEAPPVVIPPPMEVPVTPAWLIALMMVGLGARSLRRKARGQN